MFSPQTDKTYPPGAAVEPEKEIIFYCNPTVFRIQSFYSKQKKIRAFPPKGSIEPAWFICNIKTEGRIQHRKDE